jgi:hypothetical protein
MVFGRAAGNHTVKIVSNTTHKPLPVEGQMYLQDMLTGELSQFAKRCLPRTNTVMICIEVDQYQHTEGNYSVSVGLMEDLSS